MPHDAELRSDLDGIDWPQLKSALAADRFDNGRSAEELQRSFANSFACVIAWLDGRVIGTARALSDGVCNAYVVDVWTHSAHRRRGIARAMMQQLLARLHGQHVYLFSDDSADFYRRVGFSEQPVGLGQVVGKWLNRST